MYDAQHRKSTAQNLDAGPKYRIPSVFKIRQAVQILADVFLLKKDKKRETV